MLEGECGEVGAAAGDGEDRERAGHEQGGAGDQREPRAEAVEGQRSDDRADRRPDQRGLARLEWLVVRDVAETETASFWRDGHLVQGGEMRAEEIGTEVFLMPASLSGEKAGSFTNTHRLLQWHDKVVDAPGDSRSIMPAAKWKASMSRRNPASTEGRSTLTATSAPVSARLAWWTWAIEAAATGGENSENSAATGRPRSSATMRIASA